MSYVGAILAAGRGTRMGALGKQYPKALLPIANRPLIEHQLQSLAGAGVKEIYVIVGDRAGQVERAVGDGSRFGVRVAYIEQGRSLGSADAVGQLAPFVDSPFVLMLGDYYVAHLDLPRLLQQAASLDCSVMLAKHERDGRALADACALEVGDDGYVTRVVEKPKVPHTDLKGCGVFVLAPDFFDAVRRTPRTMLRDEYELIVSIDLYVRDGHRVQVEEFASWDANLTRPTDVLQCNLRWLDDEARSELVGENVRLASGTRLERAVVGDDVLIQRPSVLKDVVVFEGVEISGGEIECALVTPGGLLTCA